MIHTSEMYILRSNGNTLTGSNSSITHSQHDFCTLSVIARTVPIESSSLLCGEMEHSYESAEQSVQPERSEPAEQQQQAEQSRSEQETE